MFNVSYIKKLNGADFWKDEKIFCNVEEINLLFNRKLLSTDQIITSKMWMRQRHLEDSQNVLKEDVDLLGAPDRPQVPGDVLVLPERQTFSAIWENRFR